MIGRDFWGGFNGGGDHVVALAEETNGVAGGKDELVFARGIAGEFFQTWFGDPRRFYSVFIEALVFENGDAVAGF